MTNGSTRAARDFVGGNELATSSRGISIYHGK
jgi:hypothetical protein